MATKQKVAPAVLVLNRFRAVGMGPRALGRELGCDHSRIIRWAKPASQHGGRGLVPTKHQDRLLELAEKHGVSLTADELIRGGFA